MYIQIPTKMYTMNALQNCTYFQVIIICSRIMLRSANLSYNDFLFVGFVNCIHYREVLYMEYARSLPL